MAAKTTTPATVTTTATPRNVAVMKAAIQQASDEINATKELKGFANGVAVRGRTAGFKGFMAGLVGRVPRVHKEAEEFSSTDDAVLARAAELYAAEMKRQK